VVLIIAIATPHSSTADDEYKGYFIPKGSIFFGNSWYLLDVEFDVTFDTCNSFRAILHDPSIYPEPDMFKPERFIKDGRLDPTVQDPSVAAFGFGRVRELRNGFIPVSFQDVQRMCPGRWFFMQSLFITAATVLAVFDIKVPVDEDGHPRKLEVRMTEGMVTWVKLCLTPRSCRQLHLVDFQNLSNA
jgi:hypothetical protein